MILLSAKKKWDNLIRLTTRKELPDREEFLRRVEEWRELLAHEKASVRPRDDSGLAGGVVLLNHLPTIIIPDIHGRTDFLPKVLKLSFEGKTVWDALAARRIQIVCVGDAHHGELRVRDRWKEAQEEFRGGFREHSAIDQEMLESFTVMETVMTLKKWFPAHFHFLKGNHENIANETGGGNRGFRKFVTEGEIVTRWVDQFLGEEFLLAYYLMEKELPLLARGWNFLVTHAEPRRSFSPDEVRNYRDNDEVIYGLTWTSNDAADEGSVREMAARFFPGSRDSLHHFGGHRATDDLYRLRAEGQYVQINRPDRMVAAVIIPNKEFDPETDIFYLDNEPETVQEGV